jgi:hypothetical protein
MRKLKIFASPPAKTGKEESPFISIFDDEKKIPFFLIIKNRVNLLRERWEAV